ncbi:MAG: TPR repeat protein, partial [Rhodothermales bacterium]
MKKAFFCGIWLCVGAAMADPTDLLAKAVAHRDAKEYAEAVDFYRQACATNDPRALDHLGWMYLRGYGVEVDFVAARALFAES